MIKAQDMAFGVGGWYEVQMKAIDNQEDEENGGPSVRRQDLQGRGRVWGRGRSLPWMKGRLVDSKAGKGECNEEAQTPKELGFGCKEEECINQHSLGYKQQQKIILANLAEKLFTKR